ncbi:MAG: hypothetical protein JNM56_01455 [Planctomycetia bacterium]|nr:hypothetical protein [Planctomycetia bacterium]
MAEELPLEAPPAPPPPGCPAAWEDRLARPMFAAAVLFLVVLAGLFHRLPREEIFEWEQETIETALVLLWLAIVAEVGLRVRQRPPTVARRQALRDFFLVACVPPLRMALPGQWHGGQVWLPWYGWRAIDASLRKALERFFSLPMIVIAFMILPLLLIDYKWSEVIVESAALSLLFDIGVSVIWLAFAVEFIIMVSVAESGWRYCLVHWIDLAIVVLPVVEVLPAAGFLAKLRLLRLEQISRMGRLYRLRALAMKGWRSFLVLDVIQRLIGQRLEKRLARLQELLAVKEEEVAELRQEIVTLQERLAQQQAAHAASLTAEPALVPAVEPLVPASAKDELP